MSEDDSKLPAYFRGDNEQKKRRKKSIKQEERVAFKLGGYRQPGSGAVAGKRGDVRAVELLAECKRTDKKSISIKIDYLKKITEEAVQYDKIPALSIEIDNPPKFVSRDWVLLPAGFVQELLEAYRSG